MVSISQCQDFSSFILTFKFTEEDHTFLTSVPTCSPCVKRRSCNSPRAKHAIGNPIACEFPRLITMSMNNIQQGFSRVMLFKAPPTGCKRLAEKCRPHVMRVSVITDRPVLPRSLTYLQSPPHGLLLLNISVGLLWPCIFSSPRQATIGSIKLR